MYKCLFFAILFLSVLNVNAQKNRTYQDSIWLTVEFNTIDDLDIKELKSLQYRIGQFRDFCKFNIHRPRVMQSPRLQFKLPKGGVFELITRDPVIKEYKRVNYLGHLFTDTLIRFDLETGEFSQERTKLQPKSKVCRVIFDIAPDKSMDTDYRMEKVVDSVATIELKKGIEERIKRLDQLLAGKIVQNLKIVDRDLADITQDERQDYRDSLVKMIDTVKVYKTAYIEEYKTDITAAQNYEYIRERILYQLKRVHPNCTIKEDYRLTYVDSLDKWLVVLPRGKYEFKLDHPTFKPISKRLEFTSDTMLKYILDIKEDMPYTYEDSIKYLYLPNTLDFSETMIVYFREGTNVEENLEMIYTLLEEHEVLAKKVKCIRAQKIRYSNAFFVTFYVADQTSLSELVARKVLKTPAPFRGWKIGNTLTEVIEAFEAKPNVLYVNPTFFNDSKMTFKATKQFKTARTEHYQQLLLKLMEEDDGTLRKIKALLKDFEEEEEKIEN